MFFFFVSAKPGDLKFLGLFDTVDELEAKADDMMLADKIKYPKKSCFSFIPATLIPL